MSRALTLSNGNLHVCLGENGLVEDLYYPRVGQDNHMLGENKTHKIGIFVDNQFSWLGQSSGWQVHVSLPHNALIGKTIFKNEALELIIEFDNFISTQKDAFINNIHIINLRDKPRDLKMFFRQAFNIGGAVHQTDTAQFIPKDNAIVHYRGKRVFVIGGKQENNSFDQHAIGLFGDGKDGTWKDAEDGFLSGSSVEYGQVDSTIGFSLQLEPHHSARLSYWLVAAKNFQDGLEIHNNFMDNGIFKELDKTEDWWHKWLTPVIKVSEKVAKNHRRRFIQSALIIKSQIDNGGAVMASTDAELMSYSRDGYCYLWPRDGAFGLWPLIRLGYKQEPRKFFEFCKNSMNASGFLHHKYLPDGSIGSSWHGFTRQGKTIVPPIQEDATAITLFMFSQYYSNLNHHDGKKALDDFYQSLVVPMANFLAKFIDPVTNLPSASFDLWEEKFQTSTYTVALVYSALFAAVELAEVMEDSKSAVFWRSQAETILSSAQKNLYNANKKFFYKGFNLDKDNNLVFDDTVDSSSSYGAFMFGLFGANSKQVKQSMKTLSNTMTYLTDKGVGRYENDTFAMTESPRSNPWVISSLWRAQYEAESGNIKEAKDIVDWVGGLAHSGTGVLPEQINPRTRESITVKPLTWSQSEYMATLLDMIE